MGLGQLRYAMAGAAVILIVGVPAALALSSFNPAGSGEGYPETANGTVTDSPAVTAHRLNGECITLDGRLDERAWQVAEAAAGFRVWDPNRGGDVSEETVFKIAYDDHAFYIGVACYEKDPANVVTQLCRRDNMTNSDQISLYIDPYHDRTTGYNFRVNPSGSQEDRYVYNDGSMDSNWNAVWQVETSVDGKGWYAEFRIPFSCVRYRHADDMTWGFQLYRYMHGRGEDTAWVIWDQETRGFVSRFGEVRGLRGIPTTRQLEIMPYLVQQTTDPAAGGAEDDLDQFQNFGADLKYALTPNLTLNATLQPDFGQVEADPAVLNLSPFETFFEEKRPFFVEGNQYFQHPDLNVFYSRRIGTGDENSRIRFAGKLTGKTSQGISVATLYAATDITESGQAHNVFKNGEQLTHFVVGRFGKEFSEGAHRINIMQTAVYKPDDRDRYDEESTRDAWASGVDFDFNFHDREYNLRGSALRSVVDPAPSKSDPFLQHDRSHGTAARLDFRKLGGKFLGGVWNRLETDELDLNDAGYLSSPDEIETGFWINYQHNATSSDALVLRGSTELDFGRSWLYGAGEGFGLDTLATGDYMRSGDRVWSYGKGHHRMAWVEWDFWWQYRNRWETWGGIDWLPEGTDRFETRDFEDKRGPLMRDPAHVFWWWGLATDYRKPVKLNCGGNHTRGNFGLADHMIFIEGYWKASTSMDYSLRVSYRDAHLDAQHIENFANLGGGIGGVSYVFGELDRRTLDVTLRGNILFNRDLSLEIYAQPYLSVGDYHNPRELAKPDSYEFQTYSAGDFDVDDYDFRYTSLNINSVLRWEYRPGSALFLVWKQGRCIDEARSDAREKSRPFDTTLDSDYLFNCEPENVFLIKVSYWFSR